MLSLALDHANLIIGRKLTAQTDYSCKNHLYSKHTRPDSPLGHLSTWDDFSSTYSLEGFIMRKIIKIVKSD